MSFWKKTIREWDLWNKTVLVRVDFNVPVNEHGVIIDDYRIRQALPTIEHLRSFNTKIILISHLGRPKDVNDKTCTLAPVAHRLQDLLHLPVIFVPDCVGSRTKKAVEAAQTGDILLLENLRYHSEEEANDDAFARELASFADVFVQDGFGVVHRAHASTTGIPKFIPGLSGLLLEREVDTITNVMSNPSRPLAVVVGGAKISDKIELLDVFIERADFVAVVGAMANTFLLAQGVDVGSSLVEADAVNTAKRILEKARARMQSEHFTFYLPHDVVVSKGTDSKNPTRVVDIQSHTWADIHVYPQKPKQQDYTIQKDEWVLDIGPISAGTIAGALKLAKTAVWNGTGGVTEIKGLHGAADPYTHGTKLIAEALVGEQAGDQNKPFTVVGGGDTVAYVESVSGLRERLDHVSTGGGASLELMVGRQLPGVEALWNRD